MPELVQTLLIVCPLVFLGGFVDSGTSAPYTHLTLRTIFRVCAS